MIRITRDTLQCETEELALYKDIEDSLNMKLRQLAGELFTSQVDIRLVSWIVSYNYYNTATRLAIWTSYNVDATWDIDI